MAGSDCTLWSGQGCMEVLLRLSEGLYKISRALLEPPVTARNCAVFWWEENREESCFCHVGSLSPRYIPVGVEAHSQVKPEAQDLRR